MALFGKMNTVGLDVSPNDMDTVKGGRQQNGVECEQYE